MRVGIYEGAIRFPYGRRFHCGLPSPAR